MYSKYVKRLIDLCIAGLGSIILLPVFVVVAISIKLDSKGPVIFRQRRVGKDNNSFDILKFRSMKIETPKDSPTHLLKDHVKYVTRVGRFLRKTSLDELPQLFNIIKGDMAIVGPRPALWNQYDLIAERDKYNANSISPGLTGWAQINGRDELEIIDKAKLDGEYVRKQSLSFDCKCLLLTIVKVLKCEGIKE